MAITYDATYYHNPDGHNMNPPKLYFISLFHVWILLQHEI
jgi:hypothetical protein